MSAKDPMNLDQLSEDFDLRGELAGRDDARVFLAKRKTDDHSVLITVVRTPPGDRGNALSHLAADTRLLPSLDHPHLLPVLDGRWVGNDAFAVITDRPNAPTLDELLARREEKFGFPRIGLILRQVNAVIEWARGHKVVHRALRLDSVYVEPGSDQVRVAFTAAPLPADGIPGSEEDGVTIARLARAMLTRSPLDPERDTKPLAELRPGLPRRVVEQTNALLGVKPDEDGERRPADIDVSEYIASVAMAEEIKRGEVACDTAIAEMTEEQRVTREELADERAAHEADLAEQARKFAQEKEETARTFAREKEEAEKALEKERTELHRTIAKEREELQRTLAREREELQKAAATERSALERDRKRLEKERSALARDRTAFERFSTRSREQIAAKLSALESQARMYEHTSELPTADRELPTLVSRDHEWTTDDDHPAFTAGEEQIATDSSFADAPEPEEPGAESDDAEDIDPPPPAADRSDAPEPFYALTDPAHQPRRAPWWKRTWQSRSRRYLGIAAVALVGVVGASLALGTGDDRGADALVTDSAAGTIERPVMLRNLTPTTAVDSTAALSGSSASQPTATPRREDDVERTEPTLTSRTEPVREEPVSAGITSTSPQVPAPAFQPAVPLDTARRVDTGGRVDTARTDIAPRGLPTPPLTPGRDTATTVPPIPSILPLPIDTTRPDSSGRGGR
jgi:hypothetical protein